MGKGRSRAKASVISEPKELASEMTGNPPDSDLVHRTSATVAVEPAPFREQLARHIAITEGLLNHSLFDGKRVAGDVTPAAIAYSKLNSAVVSMKQALGRI